MLGYSEDGGKDVLEGQGSNIGCTFWRKKVGTSHDGKFCRLYGSLQPEWAVLSRNVPEVTLLHALIIPPVIILGNLSKKLEMKEMSRPVIRRESMPPHQAPILLHPSILPHLILQHHAAFTDFALQHSASK